MRRSKTSKVLSKLSEGVVNVHVPERETVLCPIKVNSNTIEFIEHTPCFCVLDLLRVMVLTSLIVQEVLDNLASTEHHNIGKQISLYKVI